MYDFRGGMMVFNIVSALLILLINFLLKAVINNSENNTPSVLHRDHFSYFYGWLFRFK
jgi:hypothetical protein